MKDLAQNALNLSSSPNGEDVIPPMTYVIDPIRVGSNGELITTDDSIGLDIDSQAETAEEDDQTASKAASLSESIHEEESKDAENQQLPEDKEKSFKETVTQATDVTEASLLSNPNSPAPANTTSVGDYKMNDEAQKLAGERKSDDRNGTKITTVEEKNEGDVKWSTYSYYIKAGGWGKFLGVIFFLLMGQLLAIIASFVLALWGDRSTRATLKGKPLTSQQNMDNLNIFALFSMMGVVGLTLRALVLAQHRLGNLFLFFLLHYSFISHYMLHICLSTLNLLTMLALCLNCVTNITLYHLYIFTMYGY
jgi:hypothetical protein